MKYVEKLNYFDSSLLMYEKKNVNIYDLPIYFKNLKL
jgi:hypothetical protein